MKKKLLLIITFTMAFIYILSAAEAGAESAASSEQSASSSQSGAPEVTAETGIVADADTGYIYYQKNMHTQMYPASITKILTGILAVEYGGDSDQITVTGDAIKGITSDFSNIALTPGEQITQEEALYTMFLASANDSANALALHIGLTMDNFVAMMNSHAKELGAVDSHFSNANGMPDKNNITSAYDMALITKKALEEPALMKYFGATSYTMPATNIHNKAVSYQTLHKMMKNTVYKYDGVIAGKTGYETMSGHTLVTAAKRDGRTLICVVMKSSSGKTVYKDTIALLNYAFAQSADNPSAEYLMSPVTVNESATVSSEPAVTAAEVKKTRPSQNKQDDKILPLLLLAFAACLFAFVFSYRRNAKKLRRRNSRRYIGSSARISSGTGTFERRRYKA